MGEMIKNLKINILVLGTNLNLTPTFEWCVIWCSSKNKYQEDTCSKDSGLCTQNPTTILDSNRQHE